MKGSPKQGHDPRVPLIQLRNRDVYPVSLTTDGMHGDHSSQDDQPAKILL